MCKNKDTTILFDKNIESYNFLWNFLSRIDSEWHGNLNCLIYIINFDLKNVINQFGFSISVFHLSPSTATLTNKNCHSFTILALKTAHMLSFTRVVKQHPSNQSFSSAVALTRRCRTCTPTKTDRQSKLKASSLKTNPIQINGFFIWWNKSMGMVVAINWINFVCWLLLSCSHFKASSFFS
jgi:hypothetical protein